MKVEISQEQYTMLRDTAAFTGVTVDWLVQNIIIGPWLQTMQDMDEYGRMIEEAEGWMPGLQY